MKAIVIEKFGGPESLVIKDVPTPEPKHGEVVIRIKAFGANNAEMHLGKGEWAEWVLISGIECAGIVDGCPGGKSEEGMPVASLMGGLSGTVLLLTRSTWCTEGPEWQVAFILAFFGSFVFGTPEFPLSEVPLQEIITMVAKKFSTLKKFKRHIA
ncbi:hypothetical protein N7508_004656 [Penicillium antarcticum]|uniref:uncharacterized protein n=1 Tax=Penicillium antarcticum TaxID=416450 RepID=UPI00239CC41D|nr:uncharacterized protein N7508_004656 [Penicillium antarcticum]KAJ5309277.1 hypothetical protein N7508_004656 [Penicillium antarcticum]